MASVDDVSQAGPVLADQATSVRTVAVGASIEDQAGNLIAVNNLVAPPAPLERLVARRALGASGEVGDGAASKVGLLDVSWCTAGPFDASVVGSIEFTTAANVDQRLAPVALIEAAPALVVPSFVLPDSGTCTRGWIPVSLDQGSDLVARYVLTAVGTEGTAQHVYQWRVGEPSVVAPDVLASPDVLRRGQKVTFETGSLKGSSVTFRGWAERVGASAAEPDARVVAAKIDVCLEGDTAPVFGIAVAGWNVINPANEVAASAESLPESGSCVESWMDFEVPLGLAPTGLFAAAPGGPSSPVAQWSFDGGAIDPPA